MNRIAQSTIVIGLALTAMSFQNCSQANFASEAVDVASTENQQGGNGNNSGGNGSVPVSEVEAEQNCTNRTLSSANANVNFPKPPRCSWQMNGNLEMKNGYAQARSEQSYSLPIPANAVICDMAFNFPTQSMNYDDQIIMTMNGYVLLSSYKPLTDLLPKDGDLRRYEWASLKGQSTNVGGYDPYIVGKELGLASVQMPATQSTGQIQMQMDKQIFYKFAAKKLPANKHQFGFITTGDDDDPSDCQHEPIAFSLNVKYYVP